MTSSDTKSTFLSLRRAAWLGLLVAGLVLIGAALADHQLKTVSHPGFLPEDMPVYLYAPDLPLSWMHFSKTALARNLNDEAAPLLHTIELSLRQWSGIRPTPARWRTWLGPSAIAATDGRDWILCVHPGLAAHVVSLFLSDKGLPGTQIHQAWREGYLLLSSSSVFIKKAQTAPPVTLEFAETISPDTLLVALHTPIQAVLTVTPSPGLPMEARCRTSQASVSRPATVWSAPPLPGSPNLLLSLSSVHSAVQLANLLSEMNLPDFSGGVLGNLASKWSINRLSSFFSDANGPLNAPMSCALYGISTSSGIPLPRLALASGAKEGFGGLLSSSQTSGKLLPYEWNGCAGWMFPLLGDQFSLYGFQRDNTQYLVTQEPLAAMVAATFKAAAPTVEDDVMLALDWKGVATELMRTANWAADRELLPETGPKDLETTFIPLMKALSHGGVLKLTGKWSADQFLCKGMLAGGPGTEQRQ